MVQADLPRLAEFLQGQNGDHRTADDLDQLIFQNPFGDGVYLLAFAENELIAVKGAIPFQVWNGRQTIDTFKAEDSFIVPAFRGAGLFAELMKMIFELTSPKPVWAFTNHEFYGKIGLPTVGRFALQFAINPNLPTSELAETLGLPKAVLLSLKNKLHSLHQSNSEKQVQPVSRSTFLQRVGRSQAIFTESFLAWRERLSTHQFYYFSEAGNAGILLIQGKVSSLIYCQKEDSDFTAAIGRFAFSQGAVVFKKWNLDTAVKAKLEAPFIFSKPGMNIVANHPLKGIQWNGLHSIV